MSLPCTNPFNSFPHHWDNSQSSYNGSRGHWRLTQNAWSYACPPQTHAPLSPSVLPLPRPPASLANLKPAQHMPPHGQLHFASFCVKCSLSRDTSSSYPSVLCSNVIDLAASSHIVQLGSLPTPRTTPPSLCCPCGPHTIAHNTVYVFIQTLSHSTRL